MHIIVFFYRKIRGNTFGSLVRKLIRVSVPMFWLGSCPSNFDRIIENPNRNFASHKYKNDYLLGRHASKGHSIEEISIFCDTVIFLFQHLGFVINWKKSVLTPVQHIEFLGLKTNSVDLEISLTEEKIQKMKQNFKIY